MAAPCLAKAVSSGAALEAGLHGGVEDAILEEMRAISEATSLRSTRGND